jgi:hypothetical protein
MATKKYREPNPAKHEYEVQRGSSHVSPMIFVGARESIAVRKAAELLAKDWPGEDHVRLYHSYPSPGPLRRYVGVIKDGVLHRAGA